MSTMRDDGKWREVPIPMPDNHHQQQQQQKCVSSRTIGDWKHNCVLWLTTKWKRKFYWCYVVVFLLCMASCVVLSLSSVDIGQYELLGLAIRQWSFLVTTVIGGPIISRTLGYIIRPLLDDIIRRLLEHDRSLKANYIYYIVELSGSIAYFLWSSTVLFAWIFISYFHYEALSHKETNPKSNTTMITINLSHQQTKTMVTITLVSLLICSILLLLKNLAIIMMKSFFHSRVFFIRAKEVAMHHQALKLVTDDALCLKQADDKQNRGQFCKQKWEQCCMQKWDQCCKKKMVIDDKDYLKKVDKEMVACSKMKALIQEIRSTNFMYKKPNERGFIVVDVITAASKHLETKILEHVDNPQLCMDNYKRQKDDFTGALQTLLQWFGNAGLRAGDHQDFKNARKLKELASQTKMLEKYMELASKIERLKKSMEPGDKIPEDILGELASEREMRKNHMESSSDKIPEIHMESGGDKIVEIHMELAALVRKMLKTYMELDGVKILKNYMEWISNYHEALARALAIDEDLFEKLNRCLNFVVILATIILWLIMANKKFKDVIILIGTAIVGSSFVIKGIADEIINSFLFIFLKHPFDVGDYCSIDNIMVKIDWINLLDTEATTFDDQKMQWSNMILAGKDIINYTRGSNTRDSVVLYLGKSTTEAQIGDLKHRIDGVILDQSSYWDEAHELVLENESDNIKATLYIKHKLHYYDPLERQMRKSILIEKLNSILPTKECNNKVSGGGARSQSSSLSKSQENKEHSSDDYDDDDDNITEKSSPDKQPSTSNQAHSIEDNGQN